MLVDESGRARSVELLDGLARGWAGRSVDKALSCGGNGVRGRGIDPATYNKVRPPDEHWEDGQMVDGPGRQQLAMLLRLESRTTTTTTNTHRLPRTRVSRPWRRRAGHSTVTLTPIDCAARGPWVRKHSALSPGAFSFFTPSLNTSGPRHREGALLGFASRC